MYWDFMRWLVVGLFIVLVMTEFTVGDETILLIVPTLIAFVAIETAIDYVIGKD